MTQQSQRRAAFAFGVVFVVVLLALAVAIPSPTPFQYTVFRVVLALAAAGVAAMVPGFLEVEVAGWIRAGGALAVFVVVYFYNPAALVVPEPEPAATSAYRIYAACEDGDQLKLDSWTFPLSDIRKVARRADFLGLVKQLPNQSCDLSRTLIFRMKDEAKIGDAHGPDAVSGGNLGAILIPESVIQRMGDEHLAFTFVHSYIQRNAPRTG